MLKILDVPPSTFKQNKYIFYYLGLDVRDCDPPLSIKDSIDLIKQMKSDPKFVYDYLVENKAKIVDSSKLEKLLLLRKEKTMKVKNKKTKIQLCQELYLKNKDLTNKQIAQQVGCHVASAARALASLRKDAFDSSVLFTESLINHIKKNFSSNNFSVEQLALSYNTEYETSFNINQFNRELKKMVRKNDITKTEKLYAVRSVSKKVVSACAGNFISKRIKSNKLKFSLDDASNEYSDVDSKKLKKSIQNWSYSRKTVHGHLIKSQGKGKYFLVAAGEGTVETKASVGSMDNTSKALEIANSLYKMVGAQNGIKLLELIESLKND
jgi:hypothetical protein